MRKLSTAKALKATPLAAPILTTILPASAALPAEASPTTPRWSGKAGTCTVPPAIGSRVRVLLNGWNNTEGTVEGYRIDGESDGDAGWVMIGVRPEARPEWHRREMPERTVCLFAGCELEQI